MALKRSVFISHRSLVAGCWFVYSPTFRREREHLALVWDNWSQGTQSSNGKHTLMTAVDCIALGKPSLRPLLSFSLLSREL